MSLLDFFEIEPYRLAGERNGKWALAITRLNRFGTDEQPFHGEPIFERRRHCAMVSNGSHRAEGGSG